MRRISYMLTPQQVKNRTKTVTRRLGWKHAKPGMRLLGVSKCQGLKPGEKAEAYCCVEVVSARREPVNAIDQADVIREGFPDMTPAEFVEFFCASHGKCRPDAVVTRIEFRYLDPPDLSPAEMAQCQRAGLFTETER